MKTNKECFDSLMKREGAFREEKKKKVRLLATILPVAACFVIMICMIPMFTRGINPIGGETTADGYTEDGSNVKLEDNSHRVDELVPEAAETDKIEHAESSVVENDNFDKTVSGLPAVMPDDFAIHYETWIGGKSIYDTYENYLQKDLVLDGVKKTGLSVSNETLTEIYKAVRDNALDKITREMTSEVLTNDDTFVRCEPMTYYIIKFTANGTTYTVTGDYTANAYTENNADAAHFWSFIQFMNDIMYNSSEYKSLPEPNGAYE